MNIVTEKRCTQCGEWKNVIEFGRDVSKKDGLRPRCKSCTNKQNSNRYHSNLETNREISRENSRTYRANNPEKRRASARNWARANYEKIKVYVKEWRVHNPDKVREQRRRQYKKNSEKILARFQKWYASISLEVHRARRRQWALETPEKQKQYRHTRYARTKNAGGIITLQEWNSLKEFYDFTCLKCGRREPEIKLTLDHVLPLSMGGSNTIDNAQCLCRSCNSSKNAKHIDYRKIKCH